jgi:hypothetical protein
LTDEPQPNVELRLDVMEHAAAIIFDGMSHDSLLPFYRTMLQRGQPLSHVVHRMYLLRDLAEHPYG